MDYTLQELLDRGLQLLRAGDHVQGSRLAEIILKEHRGHPSAHLYAAEAASMSGDPKGAIACLDSLPQTGLDDSRVLLRKAQLLYNDSQRAAALETLRAAAELVEPEEPQLRAVARILIDCQDLEGARAWLDRSLNLLPGNHRILYDLALTEFHLNLADEAEQHIASLLQIDPYHSGALHLRSALRTHTPESNHIDDLKNRLQQKPNFDNVVTATCFALAKEYEELGQYEESFAALTRGAGAYRGTLKYDSATELAAHEQIREEFTEEVFSSLGSGFETEGPVFVIGMPRTGTTLVERLLSSHSDVTSIGEFTDFPMMLTDLMRQVPAGETAQASGVALSLGIDFRELGRNYDQAARQLADDKPRYVDKLPYNFLYCGYIAAALPNARLIHLTRDPLDTLYAVYKTLFFNAYTYSYDLGELTDYYISYRKQMAHWHQVLPGRILDVNYEQLVQDPEAQARRILEWCGLPWQESVLDFHTQDSPALTASAMQVRKPMHTDSIGAWQRAGGGFESVAERLRSEGLIED
jgi:tetratricopeptide (TPR) repeat protein